MPVTYQLAELLPDSRKAGYDKSESSCCIAWRYSRHSYPGESRQVRVATGDGAVGFRFVAREQLASRLRSVTSRRVNVFPAALFCIALLAQGVRAQQPSSENSPTNTASRVRIVKKDRSFQLLRDEQPYFVKGAVVGPGGSLEALRTAGANSIRTQPGMLEEAQRHGFTALVGLPLGNPRKGFNYTDARQVQAQFERVRDIVRKYRRHPSLLCWNLGNEPEIQTTPAERVPLWKEVNRLAQMVKQEDPDHPVMAVIGGQYADMLHELNQYCPALDLVGLNSYAQMLKLPEEIAKEGWTRPYIVTEFGPRGHWQVPKTAWKVPIEDDANAKAEFYLQAYQHSVSGQPACLGSYVFYWAHKQEKTHTWYGMFLPDGSRTPAIDVMSFLWTGQWPTNRCAVLRGTKLTVASAENKGPVRPGVFLPGTRLACAIEVSDPDNDPLRIDWELRPDVADNSKVGGDWEPGVEPLPGAVLSTIDEGRRAVLQLPAKPGKYRVFVYAHDDHGNATTANIPILAEYPPVPPWQPDAQQRDQLRRSLTLLQTSTPTDRKTVRVLFYGQSISQQAWWKEVERYLRSTYTNANLLIENRAIGGHASQLLGKTAEADLYPFQPDLLIFHVYGSHLEYEDIIRRVRERTCADILLQTDHITQDRSLTEETDPAKLTPKDWDAWMNHAFLPTTAAKYGACRADVHELWKQYFRAHHLKAADLLRDGVHLNAHGEWLMAELLEAYLAPLPPKADYDALNEPRVRTVSVPSSGDRNSLRLEFTGTRADLLWKSKATGSVSVLIDGQAPSTIPQLYGFTRVSAFPGSDWPLLLRVGAGAPLVAEDWSMKIDQASPDGKLCHFRLLGTVTGDDGEGYSTNRFVSKSGRIVIEPEDWNLPYSVGVFKRPLPENYTATWRAVLRGTDNAGPPDAAPGTEACVTVVQGLSPGPHVLELRGSSLAEQLRDVRFYHPPNEAAPGSQSAPAPGSQ